jgi:broad specificity phosphatase PhoE
MKILYFVRHGESTGNVGDFRQGPDTPLSDHGREQATFLGKRFITIPIDCVISSTYTRTKETTELILKEIPYTPEVIYSDLCVERIKPTSVIGTKRDDPRSIEIDKLTEKHFHNLDFKIEDGETFGEMKQRAKDLLAYIDSLPYEHILIVTHGIFMRMVLAYILLGAELTSHQYWNFYERILLANTSITIFKEKMYKDKKNLRLVVWGDHAHLGEVASKSGDWM